MNDSAIRSCWRHVTGLANKIALLRHKCQTNYGHMFTLKSKTNIILNFLTSLTPEQAPFRDTQNSKKKNFKKISLHQNWIFLIFVYSVKAGSICYIMPTWRRVIELFKKALGNMQSWLPPQNVEIGAESHRIFLKEAKNFML